MNKEPKYISYMELAISEAKKAQKFGEIPIWAVVVDSLKDKVITKNHNRVLQLKDPTAHAELLVIRDACKLLNTERIVDCSLYVTLEPCAMCAAAISELHIDKIYFGAYDEKKGSLESMMKIYNQHHFFVPEVYGGMNELECSLLLKHFFMDQR